MMNFTSAEIKDLQITRSVLSCKGNKYSNPSTPKSTSKVKSALSYKNLFGLKKDDASDARTSTASARFSNSSAKVKSGENVTVNKPVRK